MLGTFLPFEAEPERWYWLALSGVIGLVVADGFLFQAYVWIGPRLGMLLMSLSPVVSGLLAWLVLAETLTWGQMGGIVLAVGGIMWVVLDRNGSAATSPDQRRYVGGLLFGLGAATGQAVGLILAKKGLDGNFPALSGNIMRMLAAAMTLWAITFSRGRPGRLFGGCWTTARRSPLLSSAQFLAPSWGCGCRCWLSSGPTSVLPVP